MQLLPTLIPTLKPIRDSKSDSFQKDTKTFQSLQDEEQRISSGTYDNPNESLVHLPNHIAKDKSNCSNNVNSSFDAASNCFIEFGTVMIYTCQNSCWSFGARTGCNNIAIPTYYQEQILLQAEP